MAGAARELLRELPEATGIPLQVLGVAGVTATCYRPPRPSHRRPQHVLQFGSRMAALQLEAPLGSDTSGREMRRHGWDICYGDTPRARLACLVAHEVSHLLDHLDAAGEHRRSHGPHFRARLLALHASGQVMRLMAWMRSQEPNPRLDRPVGAGVARPPARHARVARRRATTSIEPRDRVIFLGPDGRERSGTVRRVNQVTVSIHEDGSPPHVWWRVPPRLLRRLDPDDPG